ncbi:hypothetical protein [Chondromyces crocatus]|uniref:Zinc-finger domain-containing protein n=1 Tax=Chondromyces crocatus TaxID=52 RepID=A0A0K1EAE2_CHOCO|nr:hypothetical protein [Chondromyces crocatus]AKT37840.1 uncharacterized protein CMC5_019830 [Chondromyces crocatus]
MSREDCGCDLFDKEGLVQRELPQPLLDYLRAHLHACSSCQRASENHDRLVSLLAANVQEVRPMAGWQGRVIQEIDRLETKSVDAQPTNGDAQPTNGDAQPTNGDAQPTNGTEGASRTDAFASGSAIAKATQARRALTAQRLVQGSVAVLSLGLLYAAVEHHAAKEIQHQETSSATSTSIDQEDPLEFIATQAPATAETIPKQDTGAFTSKPMASHGFGSRIPKKVPSSKEGTEANATGSSAAPHSIFDRLGSEEGYRSFDSISAQDVLRTLAAKTASCGRGSAKRTGTVYVTFARTGSILSISLDIPPDSASESGECLMKLFRSARIAPFSGNSPALSQTFRY